jgi:hypothetical protein
MNEVRPAVKACYQKHRTAGIVLVAYKIDPAGTVPQVEAQGTLAGTPTGDCVAEAVRAAHFSVFSGPEMSVTYPFVLP